MIPKELSAEPSVQKARDIKDEAYKVSQLTIGLYPPKLEAEQANEIRQQLQSVATPLQNKLFQEQLQETSERMVSLCDKTCPTIFGQEEVGIIKSLCGGGIIHTLINLPAEQSSSL